MKATTKAYASSCIDDVNFMNIERYKSIAAEMTIERRYPITARNDGQSLDMILCILAE